MVIPLLANQDLTPMLVQSEGIYFLSLLSCMMKVFLVVTLRSKEGAELETEFSRRFDATRATGYGACHFLTYYNVQPLNSCPPLEELEGIHLQ